MKILKSEIFQGTLMGAVIGFAISTSSKSKQGQQQIILISAGIGAFIGWQIKKSKQPKK